MKPLDHLAAADLEIAAPADDGPGSPAVDLLAARHPIYDDKLRVAAYELVMHARTDAGDLREGHGAATPETVAAIADGLVGSHPVHVKVSREVLLSGAASLLPADRIVVEVTPEAGEDDALAEAMRSLRRTGHVVVLDGFRFSEQALPLIRAARLVKIDAGSLDGFELECEVSCFRAELEGGLIATGVENQDILQTCRALGFGLFQGFLFLEPKVKAAAGVPSSQLARARLLRAVEQPEPSLHALQEAVSQDLGLSYALLRFTNSALFALPRRVESIRDAAVLLGIGNLRRWASLSVPADHDPPGPSEPMIAGLARARMCELLASAYGHADRGAFFTAGLFSVADALMEAPLVQVLSELPFSEETNAAILNFEGVKGEALRAAIAAERGNLSELVAPRGMAVEEVRDTYREAVAWAAGLS